MIIDIHNHPDYNGHGLEKCIANMDALGIDKACMLSWEAPKDEYNVEYYTRDLPDTGPTGPIPFSRCLYYAEKAPERFILGFCPDIRKADAIDRMKAAGSIYDVKICGELKLRVMYDDLDALRFYRYCGEAGLAVLVHIDYPLPTGVNYPRPSYWYGGGIEPFERAVRACPETIFLGHAPGFWAHISGDDRYLTEQYPDGPVKPGGKLVEMMRAYPNLYCDISGESGCNGLSRDPAHAIAFLTEFQDRVLYGRDDFDNRHMEFLATLDLPGGIKNKIFSENALMILNL